MSATAPADTAIELLERWFGAFNAHDLDALCDLADPQVEILPLHETESAPPGTAYHGHAGLRTLMGAGFDRFPKLRVDHGPPYLETGTRITVDLSFVLDDGKKPAGTRKASCDYRIAQGRIRSIAAFERDVNTYASRRPAYPLSPREAEVLSLLAGGQTIDEIAEQLVLSPLTVRTHVRNAKERLEARTTAHAIARALEDGSLSV